MNSPMESTDEYRRFLEWQILSQLRRQENFAQPVRHGRFSRLKPALLVSLSVLFGVVGVTATEQLQEARQKDQILTVLRAEMDLAEVRISLAQKYLQEVRSRFDAGLVGRESIEGAERDLNLADVALSKIRLRIEEVQISGMPPQDETTAPMIGDRDFVGERLKLDMMVAWQQEAMVTRNLTETIRRFDAGLIPQLTVLEAKAEFTRVTGEASAINLLIALRNQFLAGSIRAEESARRRVQIQAQNRLVLAQSLLGIARQKYDHIHEMYEAGEVDEVILLKAQLEMVIQQAELKKLREQLLLFEQTSLLPPPSMKN